MNIYESLLAKAINGGGSGGNPNSKQVINATLENPWGSTELASRYQSAWQTGGASAELVFDATALGFGVFENPIDSTSLEGCSVADGHSIAYSISFSGANNTAGSLASAVVVQDGTIMDLSQYSNIVPSTLTIYWHPMP